MVISEVGVTLFFQHRRCKPQGKMAGALLITCVILSAIYTFLTSQERFICFPLARRGQHRPCSGNSEPCNPATRPEIPSLKVFCKCFVWKQKACYKITLGLVQQEVGLQMQDPGFCSPAPRCLPASAGPQSIPASIRRRGHVGSISRCQLSHVVFLQPRLGQPAIYRAITDFFQEKQAHLSPFCSGWKAGKAKY